MLEATSVINAFVPLIISNSEQFAVYMIETLESTFAYFDSFLNIS